MRKRVVRLRYADDFPPTKMSDVYGVERCPSCDGRLDWCLIGGFSNDDQKACVKWDSAAGGCVPTGINSACGADLRS